MSEFREELLLSTVDKKRVISIIIVAILLIAMFAFSSSLFSVLWGSQRPSPNDKLSEAEYEETKLVQIPFPYNFSDFLNLNLTQDQLNDLLDALQDMFDGNIDNLDLGNFSEALLALMGSEIEVFRVYEYDDLSNMSKNLWKFECFDQYTGDGWESTAATQIYPFYPYNDYLSKHSDSDLIKIKMPISPNSGQNSMVIPSLFPTPFIINGSIYADLMVPGSAVLYKDDFNSTTLSLEFNSAGDDNLSYYLFGLRLPSNDEINSSALSPAYTPIGIQSKYLQLPPSIDAYKANNPYFYLHYLEINKTIKLKDNAFMIANKIRDYLQYHFSLPSDPNSYSPAPAGRDVVDYFCETQEGLWSDFASAFCAFTRAFGVASRFVNGFNSIGIEEIYENGAPTFAIKYKNLYSWAEIYIPTDTSGNGQWVQMDILFDSYGTGSNPWTTENYTISVSTNFTAGYRYNQIANITAKLSLNGTPISEKYITFIDLATDNMIGRALTNDKGEASILVNIDNSQVAGLHIIKALYNPMIFNMTTYVVYGNVDLNLISVNPQEVNISETTLFNIRGNVVDPLNNLSVRGATLEFVLLRKGTNIKVTNPFDFIYTDTDSNGNFDIDLNVNTSVPIGKYQIRVDFNGSFYGYPYAVGKMNASSNRVDFNITKGQVKKLWFYINDYPSDDAENPSITRSSTLKLKAIVLNETNYPLSNQIVYFYNNLTGSLIGSNVTDSNGVTTLDFIVNPSVSVDGPNLIYAKLNPLAINYSYYIVNEKPTIHFIDGPIPRIINRTGGGDTTFRVVGRISDHLNDSLPIKFAQIKLKMFKGGTDYSSYLQPFDPYPFTTDSAGYFNLTFGVLSDTPTGNYTLRLDFDGIIDLTSESNYPHFFNISTLSNSTYLTSELKIVTPATLSFNFYINGTTSDDYDQPIVERNGVLNLSAHIEWGGTPIADNEEIEFYDETQKYYIGSALTNNGTAWILYHTNQSTIAGPHLLHVRYGSHYNYSYFILNAPIKVDIISGPLPEIINKSGPFDRNFTLQGYILDRKNNKPIKYANINVALYDGTTDVSHYLIHNSGTLNLDENGFFNVTYSVTSSTPPKNYTVKVEFDGTFIYSAPNNFNNEYDFYLWYFNNFTTYSAGLYELKVIDPYDININFWINGTATLLTYDDSNLPERFLPGNIINFSVYIIQSGSPVTSGTVVLTDVYINSQIGSYTFNMGDNGRHSFLIDTSTWHAGLHLIKVQWSTVPNYNTTYVIINKTFTISPNISFNEVQRNADSFIVDGTVHDGSTSLRGLKVRIVLLDSTHSDVTSYLYVDESQPITISSDGTFKFTINSISIDCPPGIYYIKIDFNGSITESGIDLSDYMIHLSSELLQFNVTAGTYITGNYDTKYVKNAFYYGDELYAYGYLRWDNGTGIAFKEVVIEIRNSTGGIIDFASGSTDGSGFFNITLTVGNWPNDAEVWAIFYPKDNFNAPFKYWVNLAEQELFRP
ncbi:MAG: transglutaminase domain-containing protein [Promethearchaeota archaeon]